MEDLMEILNSGFGSAMEDAAFGIGSLEDYISDLTEFCNNSNIDEEIKTSITNLIKSINSLSDNIDNIAEIYEQITDIAEEDDDEYEDEGF